MTQTTEIDLFDPDQVFASDLPDYNKLYLLSFIAGSEDRELRRSAIRYIRDMIGQDGAFLFIGFISYYTENCPDVSYPSLEEAMKRVVELIG